MNANGPVVLAKPSASPCLHGRDLGVHDRTLEVATIVQENRIFTKLVEEVR